MSGQQTSLADLDDDDDLLAIEITGGGGSRADDGDPSGAGQDAGDGSAPEGEGRKANWESRFRAERSKRRRLEKDFGQLEQRVAALAAGTEEHLTRLTRDGAGLTAIQVQQRVANFERAVTAAEQAHVTALENGDALGIHAAEKAMDEAREGLRGARLHAKGFGQEFDKVQKTPVKIALPEKRAEPAPEVLNLREAWQEENPWFKGDWSDPDQMYVRQLSDKLGKDGLPPSDPKHWAEITKTMKRRAPELYEGQEEREPAGGEEEEVQPPPRQQQQQRRRPAGEQVRSPPSTRALGSDRGSKTVRGFEFTPIERAHWAEAGYDLSKPADYDRASKAKEKMLRKQGRL